MSRKVLKWLLQATLTFALVLSVTSDHFTNADPTDDFSLTLKKSYPSESFILMPEWRVRHILQDRLDLFPKSQVPRLAHHFVALCKRHHFDPAFVLALIQVESRFRIRIKSPAGAVGLMQLMPTTAKIVAKKMAISTRITERALTDPYLNLELGVAYLAHLRDHFQNASPFYLVAAYNIGPAKMDELLAQESFTPVLTKKYFDAVRLGIPTFRYYDNGQGHGQNYPKYKKLSGHARRKSHLPPRAATFRPPVRDHGEF